MHRTGRFKIPVTPDRQKSMLYSLIYKNPTGAKKALITNDSPPSGAEYSTCNRMLLAYEHPLIKLNSFHRPKSLLPPPSSISF